MNSRVSPYFSGLFILLFILLGGGVCVPGRQFWGQLPTPIFSDIKFEIAQNLIFVRARLNNSEPLWFILDSGASLSVVNEKIARSLGFKLGSKNKINAVGGKIDYSLAGNINFDVSGAPLSDQTVAAIDLSVLEPKFGRSIDGILGAEFFNRYVIEVDYATQTINLYDPASFEYAGAGEIVEFELENNTPFVRVRLSPKDREFIEGKFLVDTGATFPLYINRRFDEKYHLLRSSEKTIPELLTTNLGGEITGRVGRMRKMAIGKFSFANADAHFLKEIDDRRGSLSSTTRDGIIGGGLFRKFKIIFDYSRRHLILQPDKNLRDPFAFDQSGLELIGAGAGFKTIRIRKVTGDSPAIEAGLRAGDIIVSVNEKAASELGIDRIEEMFRQPEREYDLVISRGTEQLKTKIKLRQLI